MFKFILAFILFIQSTALAMPPIMPLKDVQKGMTGIAYTVVDSSNKIQTFNVKIIGSIQNPKSSKPLIMAEASGDLVNRTGGILQGMSGSPVYVNGKLVGALSAAFQNMSPYTFLITPIEYMIDIWRNPDNVNVNLYEQIENVKENIAYNTKKNDDDEKSEDNAAENKDKSAETKVTDKNISNEKDADKVKKSDDDKKSEDNAAKNKDKSAETKDADKNISNKKDADKVKKSDDDKKSEDNAAKNKDKSADKNISNEKDNDKVKKYDNEKNAVDEKNISDDAEEKANVIYNGFSNSGLEFLKNSLLPELNFKEFEISKSDSVSAIKYNAKLVGGSPIGVAVVCGDFVVGATGTVTLVEGNQVLGFGHKYLHGGNVNYFMTDANIVGAVPGIVGGMKIATVGSIIGRINQDRDAGIGGIIGQFPSVVPISITVNENDKYNALIAYNEALVPKLGAIIAYSALSSHLDSDAAGGTAKLSFDIKTNAVDSGNLSRENIFYNAADVGQVAITELLQALSLVCGNTTTESDILGIDVKINYDILRNTASLVKAESNKKLVKPGEEIKLKVTLQPYRRKEIVLEVPYKVPVTAKEGALVLDLHGGGLVPVVQVQQAGVVLPSTKSPKQTYDDKIKQLLNSNKNNEIIIKPAAVVRTEKELKAEVKRVKKLSARMQKLGIKPTATVPGKFATDYIIDNVIQCTVNVDKL